MKQPSVDTMLKAANRAVSYAQDVRGYHRRRNRRGTRQRELDLQMARDRIEKAMKPIRAYLGRAPYAPQGVVASEDLAAIKIASFDLQRERRKLWKMQNPVWVPPKKERTVWDDLKKAASGRGSVGSPA